MIIHKNKKTLGWSGKTVDLSGVCSVAILGGDLITLINELDDWQMQVRVLDFCFDIGIDHFIPSRGVRLTL